MWYIYTISWLGFSVQLVVITLSIAAGLFYLAELVEEYTAVAGKVIKYLNLFVCLVLLGFIFLEDIPYSLIISCSISHILYHFILTTFPVISLSSPSFILSLVFILVDHYLAFNHFTDVNYNFSEILGFFTINLWLVPLSLFISLSASDNVLPYSMTPNFQTADTDSDVVSSYFSRKGRKYGLLTFLKSAQDTMLPQRVKKTF